MPEPGSKQGGTLIKKRHMWGCRHKGRDGQVLGVLIRSALLLHRLRLATYAAGSVTKRDDL